MSGFVGGTIPELMKLHGVEYPRHNTRERPGLTELRRASLLAGHLDEAASLTTGRQRALYMKIRELWARVEADRRLLAAQSEREAERVCPRLFPTGGHTSPIPPPGNE